MRILLLTQLFDPEPSLLLGLKFAKQLGAMGHQVQVLTGFPNYPTGKIYPGYRLRLWQRETVDEVEIVRVPHYPSHDRSALRRACSYLSMACSQSLLGPFLLRRPDIVFVSIGPMTLSIPALWLRMIWGTPFLLDIQDLWPESVTGSGMLRARWIEKLIGQGCKFAYRRARRMIVLSEGYKRLLVKRGTRPDDVAVIHNWCDPSQENGNFEAPTPDTFGLGGTFNVVYAGNLGELQALETVVHAAKLLNNQVPQVRFIFLGSGTREAALKQLAEAEGASNVRFISRLPLDRLAEVFHFASLLLVHLKQDPLSDVGIPQKIQAYLASGIPILAGVRGDAAELVERSRGGRTCKPESPRDLADSVAVIAALSDSERKAMGMQGRQYYVENLSFDVGVRHVVRVLEGVARPT